MMWVLPSEGLRGRVSPGAGWDTESLMDCLGVQLNRLRLAPASQTTDTKHRPAAGHEALVPGKCTGWGAAGAAGGKRLTPGQFPGNCPARRERTALRSS